MIFPSRNALVRLVTFSSTEPRRAAYSGLMKIVVSMTLAVSFLSTLPAVRAAEPIAIGMTAEHWRAGENAEFLQTLGFPRGLMRLNSGSAALKEIALAEGT